MNRVGRRAVLAAGGVAAAGTLSWALVPRKLAPPQVLHPAAAPAEGGPPLKPDLSALIARTPPAPPPEVSFTDAEGAARRLADYRGHKLVVNLWATWCVPCVAELPALAVLARKGAGAGLLVLPLSSDRGGAPVVRRYFDAHGIAGLPVLVDPRGEAGLAWGARGIPTTLLLDAEGREHGRMEGAVDWGSDAVLAQVLALVG